MDSRFANHGGPGDNQGMNVSLRKALTFAAPVAIMSVTRGASATEPVQDIGVLPPSQPQPAQPQYAQPQYGQPQYAQPYTYAPQDPRYPQGQVMYPVYQRPRPHAYRDGDPIPPGYHVEEKPRSGLVTGGLIMVLVPYSIGVFATLAANFGNESSWLLAPVVGPWMTMGQRRYNGCDSSAKSDASNALGCTGDVFVTMGLIVSGILQAAGGTLLLVGILNPKSTLVRDDAALHIRPMNVGSGYGLGLQSAF